MDIAICTICRQEENYIKEFLDFYINAGVKHIYLYDNNLPDYTIKLKDVVKDYTQVTVIDYTEGHEYGKAVLDAYTEFYAKYALNYDWVGFLDCDEFLYQDNEPINKIQFEALLNNSKDILHINWQILDDNDLLTYDNRPLMERFKRPVFTEHDENYHIKTFIRPGLNVYFYSPHTPIFNDNMYIVTDIDGNIIDNTFKTNEVKHRICLRHPRTKTIQEYCQNKISKLTMGGYKNISFDEDFFFFINEYTEEKEKMYKEYMAQYNYIDYNQRVNTVNTKLPNITIITALFNDYDNLLEIKNKLNNNIKYLCITDNEKLKSETWTVIKAPKYIMDMKPIERYKYIKFHTWEFTDDLLIHYVDATLEVNVSALIPLYLKVFNNDLSVFYHPLRNSVQDELFHWLMTRNYRQSMDILNNLYYKNNAKIQHLYFLCSFILRPTEIVKEMFKDLWVYMKKYGANNDVSRSDQVLFPYVLEKYEKQLNLMIMNPSILDSYVLQRYEHKRYIRWRAQYRTFYIKNNSIIKPLYIFEYFPNKFNCLIISNDTSNVYFYQQLLGTRYNHPFIGNMQRRDDFINTVKYLKTAKWDEYTMKESSELSGGKPNYLQVTTNNIDINYIYYDFNANDKTYILHANRMIKCLNNKDSNIVIIVNENDSCNNILEEMTNICSVYNYKLIYCSNKLSKTNLEKNILKINRVFNPNELCGYIQLNRNYVEWLKY